MGPNPIGFDFVDSFLEKQHALPAEWSSRSLTDTLFAILTLCSWDSPLPAGTSFQSSYAENGRPTSIPHFDHSHHPNESSEESKRVHVVFPWHIWYSGLSRLRECPCKIVFDKEVYE